MGTDIGGRAVSVVTRGEAMNYTASPFRRSHWQAVTRNDPEIERWLCHWHRSTQFDCPFSLSLTDTGQRSLKHSVTDTEPDGFLSLSRTDTGLDSFPLFVTDSDTNPDSSLS